MPDTRKLALTLLVNVRGAVEAALRSPTLTKEQKDDLQLLFRRAESSTVRLDASLHGQRYDPDGKLVDMEGPPTAEQLQQRELDLYAGLLAYLEIGGTIVISPEVQTHIDNAQARRARQARAEEVQEVAITIREVIQEQPQLPPLKAGKKYVEQHLLELVNAKLTAKQIPPREADTLAKIISQMNRARL
jgi:hypothetical protein